MEWSGTWDPESSTKPPNYPKNKPADLFSGWAAMDKDEEFEIGNNTCREFLKNHFPFPLKPFQFLELGCSNGWLTRWVAQNRPQSTKLVGVDVAPLMINKATGYFSSLNPTNVEFICSDLMDYTPPNPFDVVYSEAVLYYVVPMENISEKIKSWVAPGGLFGAGTDFYLENPKCEWWPEMMNIDMDRRSAADWKTLFEKSFGLENVSQIVLKYDYQDETEVGTLFTFGYLPVDPNSQ